MADRDLGKDIDALKKDLDALRTDVASLVDTLKGSAESKAEAEITALQDRLNKLAGDMGKTGRENLRAVEGQIEERPLTSVAMAFAVGMVLGRLFDRR